MSVDLKGNTNFVVLKNLQDELTVPRTNLAAVDMAVANGLAVAGSTLSITLATTEDIELGTTGSVVTPDALKPILDNKQTALEAGTGVELVAGETASTISVPITDVETLIDGTTATKVVDVAALRGALTAGQAVDVTSMPDNASDRDWRGTFPWTLVTLGFASFPKFKLGLKYLMIADITAHLGGTVTPGGTWLDGTTAAISLQAETTTRVAMLFDTVDGGMFSFSGTGDLTVTDLREYEVTSCTPEAIAYIAQLDDPDVFADYYLVKSDMVQPWTYIIDMGTSPAVTIAAGLSYKLNATTGTHTLTVDTCPEGYDGRDSIIRIRLGGTGIVQAVAPLQLGGALVPYAINNCVVRFRDGEAVLQVEDTLAGYVVSVNTGTDEGSLPYGLAATGVPYIAFSPSTDDTPVELSGATTAAEDVVVIGNNYEKTVLTGEITCTAKTILSNLSLQDVIVAGGTLTFGDVSIPSGSTVAVSSGGLAFEKVTGDGVIDLGGNFVYGNGSFSGVTLSGGTLASGSLEATGGAVVSLDMSSGTSLSFSGSNTAELIYGSSASVILTSGASLDLTGNTNATPVAPGGNITITSCGISYDAGGTLATPVSASILLNASTTKPAQIRNDGTIVWPSNTVSFRNTNVLDKVNIEVVNNSGSRYIVVYQNDSNLSFSNGKATASFALQAKVGGTPRGGALSLSGTVEVNSTKLVSNMSSEVLNTGTLNIAAGTTLKGAWGTSRTAITPSIGTVVIESNVTVITGTTSHTFTADTYPNATLYNDGTVDTD